MDSALRTSFFYEGQDLKAVCRPDGYGITAGSFGCKSITVFMEKGETGLVPWALAVGTNGRRAKFALASYESVEI